jgi:hypothetical protein
MIRSHPNHRFEAEEARFAGETRVRRTRHIEICSSPKPRLESPPPASVVPAHVVEMGSIQFILQQREEVRVDG